MADRPGFFRRFFRGLWSFLNFTRQLVFNVLFFAIVAVLAGRLVHRRRAGRGAP